MALYTVQNSAPEAKGWLWRQLGVGGSAWCKLWVRLLAQDFKQSALNRQHALMSVSLRWNLSRAFQIQSLSGVWVLRRLC